MHLTDLFWIFLVVAALQPVLWQRMLMAMRTRKISEIERKRGSRVILLVHRQETMRLLGFPLVRYIDMQDCEQVLRAIHMTADDVPLDIVLHTPAGLALAAVQIAQAIRDRSSKVCVFVPHYAMSGGTLIALAADEIIMCSHAALGPIDPQLEKYAAASLLRAIEQKSVAEVDHETLVLADVGRKAIAQVKEVARGLLAEHLAAERAEAIADQLTRGAWTHDYPILAAEAKQLGLPVSTSMPAAILELMTLYPQPVRTLAGGNASAPGVGARSGRGPEPLVGSGLRCEYAQR